MAETIGLYVHVPFCATKCGYCDFYSHTPSQGGFEPLVEALCGELELRLPDVNGRIVTVFVGGGTPTLLSTAAFQRLFDRLGRIVDQHRPDEFTVEANPASLTDSKAIILRDSGVTRISMGAQSFHAHELRILDRLHNASDIAPAVEIVKRRGFEHLNLDLIFGVPGQSGKTWLDSLEKAIRLEPDHLACYGLTYEPGTALRDRLDAGLVDRSEEDLESELYLTTLRELPTAGYQQYELSNFAVPGGESLHNLRYWHNQPVLGIGPSAASYIDGVRWRNLPDTAEYTRRIVNREDARIDIEKLDPEASAGETAMLRLRLSEGIRRTDFREQTGFDPYELFADAIASHAGRGLLDCDGESVRLTARGMLLADTVMADFLLPQTRSAAKKARLRVLESS